MGPDDGSRALLEEVKGRHSSVESFITYKVIVIIIL